MSSKTVTRNCNQKLLSKVVIKKFPSKIGNLVTLAISLCMYISTFTQYCQSTLRLMYILILYHYCIRIAFVLHSYCIRIALSQLYNFHQNKCVKREKLASKVVIKKIPIKNCHQKLSSKIFIKNCHQKFSSKIIIKNRHHKLS